MKSGAEGSQGEKKTDGQAGPGPRMIYIPPERAVIVRLLFAGSRTEKVLVSENP